jgi:hypothetical protein
MAEGVGECEGELLIGGLSDDVAFGWVLIHLGLRGNPPADPGPPTFEQIDDAVAVLSWLSEAGLIKVGRTEYIDGGPPGRVAPVRYVEEPLETVRTRIVRACDTGKDWEWSCWVVNTDRGDEVAEALLAER